MPSVEALSCNDRFRQSRYLLAPINDGAKVILFHRFAQNIIQDELIGTVPPLAAYDPHEIVFPAHWWRGLPINVAAGGIVGQDLLRSLVYQDSAKSIVILKGAVNLFLIGANSP